MIPVVVVLTSALLGGCNSGQADELAAAKTELEKLKTEVSSLNDQVKESKGKVTTLEKDNKTLTDQLVLYREQTKNKETSTTTNKDVDDPDLCEYIVSVEWIKNVPKHEAVWEKGMFANQNSACKLRNQFTIERLTDWFRLEDELPQEL
jgi:predicted nuclease with TOPRIM domain